MATTKNDIFYPSDYDSIADIPEDMKKLAESVDECIDELKETNNKFATSIKKLQEEITSIKETNEDQDKSIKENTKSIEEIKEEAAEIKAENVRLRSDINSIALIGEAEGESIDLDDSSDARFLEFGLSGNHKQEVRKGSNLVDFNVEQNSKVTVNEDGTITINGSGGFSLNFRKFTAEANKKYYIKWELVTGTVTGFNDFMVFMNPITSASWINKDIFVESSVTEDKELSSFWIHADAVFTNATIKLWINTDKSDFEKYGASPSIDYPSEVETVGNNVQLFDKDNEDMFLNGLTPNNSGEIQVSITDTSASKYLVTIIVPCLPNSTYIISRYVEGKTFFVYESSKKDLKAGDNVTFLKRNDNTGIINEKITTGANAKYLLVKIYNTYVIEPNTYNDLISSIKIEKGLIATPYSPYNQGCVEVNVVNKNFTKVDEDTDFSISNVSFKYKNGGLLLNGTSNSNISSVDGNFKKFLRFTLPKGSYVYSQKNSVNMNIFTYLLNYSDNTRYATTNGNSVKSAKFTLEKNTNVYIGIYSASNVIFDNIEIEFQVKQDTTATDCTEHKEQTFIIPTQQEMLKGDHFDFDREKEVHKWGKYIFTGEESVRFTTNNNSFALDKTDMLCNIQQELIPSLISNSYRVSSWIDRNEKNIENTFSQYNNILGFDKGSLTTPNEFKALLKSKYDAGTPVIIYYQLATPVELDFTDEQKAVAKQIKQTLHTYKNVTHIYSDDEVSPIFNIKYAKDPNVKNDSLQKQIDEIKQLLSTTQTSALLLDNLQKEVESEVI